MDYLIHLMVSVRSTGEVLPGEKRFQQRPGPLGQHFETPDFRVCGCGTFSWPFLRIKTLDPTWECGFKAFQWRLGQPNLTKITLIPKNHRMMDVLFINVTHTHTLEQFRSNSVFSGSPITCIWFSFWFFHLHRNAYRILVNQHWTELCCSTSHDIILRLYDKNKRKKYHINERNYK